jgi:hypothetical protein
MYRKILFAIIETQNCSGPSIAIAEMLLYGLLHRRQDDASPEGERRLIVRCHRYFPASPATLEHKPCRPASYSNPSVFSKNKELGYSLVNWPSKC